MFPDAPPPLSQGYSVCVLQSFWIAPWPEIVASSQWRQSSVPRLQYVFIIHLPRPDCARRTGRGSAEVWQHCNITARVPVTSRWFNRDYSRDSVIANTWRKSWSSRRESLFFSSSTEVFNYSTVFLCTVSPISWVTLDRVLFKFNEQAHALTSKHALSLSLSLSLSRTHARTHTHTHTHAHTHTHTHTYTHVHTRTHSHSTNHLL